MIFVCGLFFCIYFPADLLGALRGRLYDSNKNLVMATLATIGNVASAMGPAVEKSGKVCCGSLDNLCLVSYPLDC